MVHRHPCLPTGPTSRLGTSAWRCAPKSHQPVAERQLCQCSLELVKPKHRLQRLFHSLQPREVPSLSSDAQTGLPSQPFNDKELAELRLLVSLLPERLQPTLLDRPDLSRLVEVVLDLGRPALARFGGEDVRLAETPVSHEDISAAVAQVGTFGDDNRAGIDRTLHRVSCIRNRDGGIVGLTCRAGRAVQGCACLAADFAAAGKSILVLGKPGVGKTTAIRELSRFLAEEAKKRVVIVDTSSEIGGDGDIPHEGVGSSRRLQVAHTELQHNVMIEAVENHMPEVVVIDEIGTAKECMAARTISQRGVQLIATAHGHKLENVLKNPSLVDLLGGVETVTIGDELAKQRGLLRKTTRERAAPPTFDVAIELLDRHRWCLYGNVAEAVDTLLQDKEPEGEVRELKTGDFPQLTTISTSSSRQEFDSDDRRPQIPGGEELVSVFPVGLDHDKILHARSVIGEKAQRVRLVFTLQFADVVLALRSQMRPKSLARDAARSANVPVYAVKTGSSRAMVRALETLLGIRSSSSQPSDSDEEEDEPRSHVVSMSAARNEAAALAEARQAVEQIVMTTNKPVELLPRAQNVIAKQIAMLKQDFSEYAFETVGVGLQSRIRILPLREVSCNDESVSTSREQVV